MDTRSTGELIASLVVNVQALLAKELELLGLEVKRIVARRIAAIVVLLLGALALAGVLLLAAVTAALALEPQFDEPWMAWGVVTLVSAVVGSVLVAVAGRRLAAGVALEASRRAADATGTWLRDLGDELGGRSRSDGGTDR